MHQLTNEQRLYACALLDEMQNALQRAEKVMRLKHMARLDGHEISDQLANQMIDTAEIDLPNYRNAVKREQEKEVPTTIPDRSRGEEVVETLPEASDGSVVEFTYDEKKDRVYIRHIGKRKTQTVILDREEWKQLREINLEDEDQDEDESKKEKKEK